MKKKFISHIPKWGGVLIDKNNQKTSFLISNTCTIDYYLLALWVSTKMTDLRITQTNMPELKTSLITSIIESIEANQWDRAKSIWIRDVANMNYEVITI